MGQVRLRDLLERCNELAKDEKNLDKIIIVGDDSEGNGFHGCWYNLELPDPAYVKEYISLAQDTERLKKDNFLLIG